MVCGIKVCYLRQWSACIAPAFGTLVVCPLKVGTGYDVCEHGLHADIASVCVHLSCT